MLAIKSPRLAIFVGAIMVALLVYGLSIFSSSQHSESGSTHARQADAPEVVTQSPRASFHAGELLGTASRLSIPAFLERPFLIASLSALKENGSDLSLPMPSKHLIRCESREIASRVAAWGRENGFEPLDGGIFLGHGGVEFFDVELRRTEVPNPDRIQEQGRLVQESVADLSGAEYATWVGEIVPAR